MKALDTFMGLGPTGKIAVSTVLALLVFGTAGYALIVMGMLILVDIVIDDIL
ncbi:hypothetical protein [Halomarina rubra]|uniref:Uncharacterized protein n=1 Tax=Halomarina rubra TaxID=2071873 RepID=A0ABD6ASJ2_9EURY|nr:hypothetical protein [Halomarina rubra]